jgi:hypothetical protein
MIANALLTFIIHYTGVLSGRSTPNKIRFKIIIELINHSNYFDYVMYYNLFLKVLLLCSINNDEFNKYYFQLNVYTKELYTIV